MRPVLPDDLDRCARALMPLPPDARPARMDAVIAAADIADRFRKRTGRMHPALGDGSLGVVAWRAGLAVRPNQCDGLYCACLAVVLHSLARWRSRGNGQA